MINITKSLLDSLRRLIPQQGLARVSGFITRLFEIYFITLVISFFLGFLNMFPFGEFGDGGFAYVIKWFMYGVMGIVVIMIANKQVKVAVGERYPESANNALLINSLTLLFSAIIIVGAWFIGTNFLGHDFGSDFFVRWAGGILSIFVLLLPYYAIKGIENKFNIKYKNILLNEFLPSSKLKVEWLKDQFLPQGDFINSKLFNFQEIYSYKGSDLFESSESDFKGSRLIVQQIEVHKSGGKSETKISELFNGYLFEAEFNKSFHGDTFIFPDHARNMLGEVYGEMANEWVKRGESKLVKLEDPDFEKRFAVYATDEVEARYLLSIKLIERINQFSAHFYQDISIALTGNKIYVAIATGKDILSPHLYGKLDDEIYLEKQLSQLQALLTIREQFDLKTKIWG